VDDVLLMFGTIINFTIFSLSSTWEVICKDTAAIRRVEASLKTKCLYLVRQDAYDNAIRVVNKMTQRLFQTIILTIYRPSSEEEIENTALR
jgi:hypothetical protein